MLTEQVDCPAYAADSCNDSPAACEAPFQHVCVLPNTGSADHGKLGSAEAASLSEVAKWWEALRVLSLNQG